MREETVTVKIDHPLGSTDEDNPSVVYPINCGYVDVERTAGFSELDKQRVFDIRFYPIILFFYGVITLKDKYYMAFPDKIMRNILLA